MQIREFEITDEIRNLGVSRICVVGKNLLFYNTRDEPIYCQYDKDDLTKTLNRLRKALKCSHEFDNKTIEKILVLLSRVLLSAQIVRKVRTCQRMKKQEPQK